MHYGASVSEVADSTAATSHSSRVITTDKRRLYRERSSVFLCYIIWPAISPAHVTFEL